MVAFGSVGSDAGRWVLGVDGKVHHVGGWPPQAREAFMSMTESFKTLQQLAAQQVKGVSNMEGSSPDPIPA